MSQPVLSVVVPCHQVEDTLEAALCSLQRQTLGDFEVVALDNACTDGTRRILDTWVSRLPSLRVIGTTECLPIGTLRNRALSETRGEFVGFLDADDWVGPHYFSRMVGKARECNLDFVKCDHVRVKGPVQTVVRAPEPRHDRVLDPRSSITRPRGMSMVDYPYSCFGLYRQAFLRQYGIRFAERAESAEDRTFTWGLHCEGHRYMVLSGSEYYYSRDQEDSLTHTGDRRQLGFLDVMPEVLAYVQGRDEPDRVVDKVHRQILSLSAFHYVSRARLNPEVHAELLERTRRLLGSLEPCRVDRALACLRQSRRDALLELMGEGWASRPPRNLLSRLLRRVKR